MAMKNIRRNVMAQSMMNALEIQTTTGNPVVFNTQIAKPLNSLIIPLTYSQEGTGNPSPSNIRPISGVSGLFCVHAKKNIANVRGYSATNRQYADAGLLSNTYGTSISSVDSVNLLVVTQTDSSTEYTKDNYRNGYFIVRMDNSSVVDGKYYDVSFKITNITNNPLDASLSDIKLIAAGGNIQGVTEVKDDLLTFKNQVYKEHSSGRCSWEIRNCGMSFTLSEFMMTPANTNDGMYEPYDGAKLDVTFPVDVGTVYGGSLDLVSGVLTLTHQILVTTWGEGASPKVLTNNERRRFEFSSACVDAGSGGSTGACNMAKWTWDYDLDFVHFYNHQIYSYLFLPIGTSDSTEIQIVGTLAEPITIQLDPHSITTIKGTNTVWTNTSENLTVTYKNKKSQGT